MTTSFKKSLIAASVGAVLAAGSFSAMAGTPGTTNLLFPFITTENGAFTFISISNQTVTGATTPLSNGGNVPLHFTYATKAAGAANGDACEHLDGNATTTTNDLLQFEVSERVKFDQFGGTSKAKFLPTQAAGRRGILIVNNASGADYGVGSYVGAALYGEARIVSTAAGLAAAYSTDDLHTTGVDAANANRPDFATNGPDAGAPSKVISWFPDPAVNTTFYMVPLGTENAMAFDGNLKATYQATDSTEGFGGHYNNKEGFQSSTAKATATCFGTFSRGGLLGSINSPFSANGGWANLTNSNATGEAANALVYKLETTNALGGTVSFITRATVK